MKTIRVVMLSFIVFVLLANPSMASLDAVRDNEGEEIKAGVEYHIIPALLDAGGLTTGNNRNNSLCPPDVIQDPNYLEKGRPVIFFPEKHEIKVIRPRTNVNILFVGPLYCRARYFMWKLDEFCVTTESLLENHPDPINWFRIEKYKDTDYYILLFCYSLCEKCEVQCLDLDIYYGDGVGRLCLSDKPSVFNIVKANPMATSSY